MKQSTVDLILEMLEEERLRHTVELILKIIKEDTVPLKRGEWELNEEQSGEYYTCTACGESLVMIEGTPKENEYNYGRLALMLDETRDEK